jgi:polysaccharide biosynthesis/export protein
MDVAARSARSGVLCGKSATSNWGCVSVTSQRWQKALIAWAVHVLLTFEIRFMVAYVFSFSRRHLKLALCAGLAVGLSGCATLPGSGPTKREIVGQSEIKNKEFSIVEISERTVEILEGRHASSFNGQFGDYRPAPDQRIGTGDAITVTIWEAAAGGLFSSPSIDGLGAGPRSAVIPAQIVSRDGAITVPYAGRVRVNGLRTQDVERAIVSRLDGKAIEPQALVSIVRNESNTVTVTGEVTNGAVVPLNVRGQRVLDVIALAGGVRSPAHETLVSLSRGNRSVEVSLQRIMAKPAENVFVRPGDTINLIRAPLTFTAVGATGQNGVVPFGQVELSLEEAVAKAGGLVDARSDPEGVFVLRYEPVKLVRSLLNDENAFAGQTDVLKPVVYKINMRSANSMFQARRFQIINKDIVYVANAPLNELQKVFALFSTVTSTASNVAALAN